MTRIQYSAREVHDMANYAEKMASKHLDDAPDAQIAILQAAQMLKHLVRERDELQETLRDKFAMAALTGRSAWGEEIVSIATLCYRIADRMMAVRRGESEG